MRSNTIRVECHRRILVDVHVFSIRKKLGAELVTTRRGQGYCIES